MDLHMLFAASWLNLHMFSVPRNLSICSMFQFSEIEFFFWEFPNDSLALLEFVVCFPILSPVLLNYIFSLFLLVGLVRGLPILLIFPKESFLCLQPCIVHFVMISLPSAMIFIVSCSLLLLCLAYSYPQTWRSIIRCFFFIFSEVLI